MVPPSICEEPLLYAAVESCLLSALPAAARVGDVPEMVESMPAEGPLFKPNDIGAFVEKTEYALILSKEKLMDINKEVREKVCRKLGAEKIKDPLLGTLLSPSLVEV